MFSGIVERTVTLTDIRIEQQNKTFTFRADFCGELKIDQSIAHNGVCLTVVDITEDTYSVTAMKETLTASNLGPVAGRRYRQCGAFDAARCAARRPYRPGPCRSDGRLHGRRGRRRQLVFYVRIRTCRADGLCTVEKGSMTVNGVSLTVCNSQEATVPAWRSFPTPIEHTNFNRIKPGYVGAIWSSTLWASTLPGS